jgi:hypothetical protein
VDDSQHAMLLNLRPANGKPSQLLQPPSPVLNPVVVYVGPTKRPEELAVLAALKPLPAKKKAAKKTAATQSEPAATAAKPAAATTTAAAPAKPKPKPKPKPPAQQ